MTTTTTTRSTTTTTFTISNICGGDLRTHRMVDGELSGAAIRHAENIGFGGPEFGGLAMDAAAAAWSRREEDMLDGYYD